MKLSALPLLLSAAGLALVQVAASPTPLRVIGMMAPAKEMGPTKDSEEIVAAIANIRWGLAAAHAVPDVSPPNPHPSVNMTLSDMRPGHGDWRHHRRPKKLSCKLRMKMLRLSNWLRKMVGLEPIRPHHRPGHGHGRGHKGHGEHRQEEDLNAVRIQALPWTKITSLESADVNIITYERVDHGGNWRASTFSGRIHKALMTLGPWEGRAVAFVLGCGIGSLLRMVYVLVVVMLRSYRSENDDVTREVDVLFFEEVEELPAPPQYSDEKVAPAEPSTASA